MDKKKALSFVVLNALIFNLLDLGIFAQQPPTADQNRDSPVVISIGRPNIWSLEQAHYLLARMHHRNLRLEPKAPDSLDPNSVNGTRVKLLRQILGISADYAQTKIPKPSDDKQGEKEMAENKAELSVTLPESAIKELDKSFSDPKLNASTELDNLINFQYENIAKQLTLLRDEVGNDERLVFLELPQSIYTTPKKGDKRVVQTWWRIEGYSQKDNESHEKAAARQDLEKSVNELENKFNNLESKLRSTKGSAAEIVKIPRKGDKVPELIKLLDETIDSFNRLKKSFNELKSSSVKNEQSTTKFVYELEGRLNQIRSNAEKYLNDTEVKDIATKIIQFKNELDSLTTVDCVVPEEERNKNENKKPIETKRIIQFAIDAKNRNAVKSGCRNYYSLNSKENPQSKTIRTIDLIPRQSSLIVNETYDSVNGLNLWGGFSWLFGLGVKANYQRQKEDFQQFLHQDVYASAFGRGETDFGWTFGPLPGTKRLAPGLRTTYAVVIVPKAAETIALKAKGCFFKQTKNQPYTFQAASNPDSWEQFDDDRFCEKEKDFIIPIPNGGDYKGFYVDEIRYYAGQESGSRTVVSVKGSDFSPQVNVMINGVSLCPSVGIAQPFLNAVNSQDTNCVVKNGITGDVEYVNSDELVFSFQMPDDFVGTPTIHLIGPGRVVYLNKLTNVRVNNANVPLEQADWMFGDAPKSPGFEIKDLKLFQIPAPHQLGGLLIGNAFKAGAQVYVNGQHATPSRLSDKQIRFTFNEVPDTKLNITVIQDDGTGTGGEDTVAATFPNLTRLTLYNISVLNYVVTKDKVTGFMLVKIEGTGLNGITLSGVDGADPKSSKIFEVSLGEIILQLANPDPVVRFRLQNAQGQTVESIVLRPKMKNPNNYNKK